MSVTIGEAISRVRNVVKGVRDDAFLTDRFIYSLMHKYSKMLIKRQENEGKIMKHEGLFKSLPCVDLIEVDAIEACCLGIKTGCTFMRTKEKLPDFMEGSHGPLIRQVSSIDGSVDVIRTYPKVYSNMTLSTYFKYNKNVYYWYLDGHIYVPNAMWESIRITAIFDEDIEGLLCTSEPGECKNEQDRDFDIPDYLFAELEQMVLQEMFQKMQVPSDNLDDNQNVLR